MVIGSIFLETYLTGQQKGDLKMYQSQETSIDKKRKSKRRERKCAFNKDLVISHPAYRVEGIQMTVNRWPRPKASGGEKASSPQSNRTAAGLLLTPLRTAADVFFSFLLFGHASKSWKHAAQHAIDSSGVDETARFRPHIVNGRRGGSSSSISQSAVGQESQ